MSDSAAFTVAPRLRKKALYVGPIVLWLFVGIWYVGIAAALFILRIRGGALVIAGFFAAVGLVVVRMAIVSTLSAIRFRGAEIELQAPGLLGGTIAGVVRVPQRVLKHDSLEFRMTAWRRMSESNDPLLWETTEPVTRRARGAGGRVTLPFSIHIPFDAVPTNVRNWGNAYDWRLELRSTKGSVSFEVPVERTALSSS